MKWADFKTKKIIFSIFNKKNLKIYKIFVRVTVTLFLILKNKMLVCTQIWIIYFKNINPYVRNCKLYLENRTRATIICSKFIKSLLYQGRRCLFWTNFKLVTQETCISLTLIIILVSPATCRMFHINPLKLMATMVRITRQSNQVGTYN